MRNSGRGNNRSGGRDFGPRRGGNRDNRQVTMHRATCAQCGKECEVPFRPTGDRPVYCSDCFEKNGNGNSDFRRPERSNDRFNDRRSDSRSNFSDRERPMFQAVCDECGNNCTLPFQPRSGKPVFCSNCFEKNGGQGQPRPERSSLPIEQLNAKLDKIIELLSPKTKAVAQKPEKVEKIAVKKPRVVKKTPKTTE